MRVDGCSQTREPDFWLTQMPHTLHPRNLVTTLTLPMPFSSSPPAPWAQDYGASSNNEQGPGKRTQEGCVVPSHPAQNKGQDSASGQRGFSPPSHNPLPFSLGGHQWCEQSDSVWTWGKGDFPGKVQPIKMATSLPRNEGLGTLDLSSPPCPRFCASSLFL